MIRFMVPEPVKPIPQASTLEEAQKLINDLWSISVEQATRIEALLKRIEELEEKLNTNSRNSSKPPSTDKGNGKKNRKSGRKAGGQPGHTGKSRTHFTEEQIDRTHHIYPPKLCDCGSEVKATRLH